VKLLLADGRIDVNKADAKHTTPFFSVCSSFKGTYLEVLKLLLIDERVDVNLTNEDEETPLIYLIHWGNLQVAQYIIASGKGLILGAKDIHKKTAMDWAQKKKYKSIVELLKSLEKNPSETRSKLSKELGIINFYLMFDFMILFYFY